MKKIILLLSVALSVFWQTADGQSVTIPSTIKGLTIMLEYKDYPFPDAVSTFSDLMNKPGYNANGALGSVRDFYYVQTNGKVTITSTVVKVSLPENKSYYEGTYNGNYVDAAIERLNMTNPEGFQGLTEDPMEPGYLLHMNFITRGTGEGVTNAVSKELYVKNNTTGSIRIGQGNVIALGVSDAPTAAISGICHEMGHSVMSWRDYYNVEHCNLGAFELMASAGTSKAPQLISPALRLQRNWITAVNVSGSVGATYTLTANDYTKVHKYTNPNNSNEYLLFHALKIGGYYQSPQDNGQVLPEGLAIWYVDEEGGFSTPGQDNGKQLYIKLVQADNLDEMHDHDIPGVPDIRGDAVDLYGNTNKSFPGAHPFRWKDGGEFGITITNISNPGTTMSFTVAPRASTVIATSDVYGTILPKGTLGISTGQSKSFSFVPNLGYELDAIKVNGATVTKSNPYVMNNISGHNNTISVTFKRKTPVVALPSPWKNGDVGSPAKAGFAASSSGVFSIESYGAGFDDYSDDFHYVYQMLNGDGTFIANIANYNMPTGRNRVGIMIRESLEANSAYSAAVKFPFGGARVEHRANGAKVDNPSDTKDLHKFNWNNWLKIERKGNLIISSCSRDGVNWNQLGSESVLFPTQVYVGLFVTGANGIYPSKAVFQNVSLSTTPTPLVSITSPINKTIFATNSATIHASAIPATTSRAISKVEFYSGSTLIGSDNTSPYSVVFSNAVGTHTLTAKATDNTGVVSVSTKINVEFPCVFSDSKITGPVIGTLGSWENSGNTREKAFDGDITTYFDAAEDVAWTGRSLSSSYKITGIKYVPRAGWTGRMLNGRFQGSNTADFSASVDLATITSEPKEGWNCFSVSNQGTYKYVRYISPAGGVGNVAEIEFYGSASVVNILPTVTFTSPQANTGVESYPSITIAANAADEDGTVSKVDFYAGSTLLGSDLTAPYTYAWTNATTGMTTLTVKATDNNGGIKSSTITVIVTHTNVLPTVAITSPASGAIIEATPIITIAATTSDVDGTVAQVDFYIGSNLVGTDLTAPYTYVWTNAALGSYTLTARATDNSGGYGYHTITNVAIVAATSIITGPTCGSNNSTLTFELSAAKRANATGYNWYYTGTSQSVTPVVGTPYKATLLAGASFTAGEVCVGVNYSSSPWYTSYCKPVAKCVSPRMAGEGMEGIALVEATLSPNPSSELFYLTLAQDAKSISVINEIGQSVYEKSTLSTGDRISLGENFLSGVYLLSIRYEDGHVDKKRLVKVK